MSLERAIQAILIFSPILLLLGLGAMIALRSGIGELKSGADYVRLAVNLSHMILRIAGYVIILIAVQYLIGMRSTFGW